MKKWEIIDKLKVQSSKFKVEDLIDILLQNRGVKGKKATEGFLHPKLESVTFESVGVDKKRLKKALERIQKAIDSKEQIAIFGDYDVDGVTSTAILWETLYGLGAKVVPYIPHRIDEGYGLSTKGISNLKSQIPNIKLIITVDNGIVANEAVDFANSINLDVIITDHHVGVEDKKAKLPKAYEIVHTTQLCGGGIAYLLDQEIKKRNKIESTEDTHLELATLATIADLVPLQGANRTLVYHGLSKLRNTKRVGLLALFEEAGIDSKTIETYTIGYIIGPRLNASGRMETAMDSLRLLCTTNRARAKTLAENLGAVNKKRQLLTQSTVAHARKFVLQIAEKKKILFLSDASYEQGIIGLVAGRLVEEFYVPSIVLSVGEKTSKASARSIHGFNIIEFIRSASSLLVNAGGHPMAAGFTVETEKIELLQKELEKRAEKMVPDDLLTRTLKIDCELDPSFISLELVNAISQLSPFGMKNLEPVFASRSVEIQQIKPLGKEGKHFKFQVRAGSFYIDAIAFGMGDRIEELGEGQRVDIAYNVGINEWNGNRKLQIKIKDFKLSEICL